MKHSIGLPASGLFASRALARAVAGCFDATRLRSATLASALALGIVASAQAATITVTNTNASGAGSLAWACARAVSNADSTDVITFSASVTGTIDLVGCDSMGDLTIRGPGAAKLRINGPYLYVFHYPDTTMRLESLTLTNARLVARYDDHTTNGVDVPLHLTTVPDTNGSGVTELAVLSRHHADGALNAEVRDAATGAIVSTMNYSSQYRADELVAVPDINNNGIAELSHVGPNSSGVVRATQRDVATGVLSSRVNVLP